MMIIGLTGKAGVGKDTVGSILVRLGFERYAFADPIRAGLDAMLDAGDARHGPDKEAPIGWIGKSARELMQTLGTEWGRNRIRDDLWIRVAEKHLLLDEGGRWPFTVITDVRFENEADWIRQRGGVIWHIQRQVTPITGHVSEHGATAGTLYQTGEQVLLNSGTHEDLIYTVAGAFDTDAYTAGQQLDGATGMTAWGHLLQAAGTLIPPAEPGAGRYTMSDGVEYTVTQLHEDPRNRDRLALSTIRHRVQAGETDLARLWQRRPKIVRAGRQNRAADTPFNRDGLPPR